jgi:predicted nucleic acid-binding Zn ribbon protein
MEEDKKVEFDSDIWKKYEKKEAKNLKIIFITIFLLAALVYVVKFLMGFF